MLFFKWNIFTIRHYSKWPKQLHKQSSSSNNNNDDDGDDNNNNNNNN